MERSGIALYRCRSALPLSGRFTVVGALYRCRSALPLSERFTVVGALYRCRSALPLLERFTVVGALYRCRSALPLSERFTVVGALRIRALQPLAPLPLERSIRSALLLIKRSVYFGALPPERSAFRGPLRQGRPSMLAPEGSFAASIFPRSLIFFPPLFNYSHFPNTTVPPAAAIGLPEGVPP